MNPFSPMATTYTLAASTSNAQVAIPGSAPAVRVFNSTSVVVFIQFNMTSGVVASVASSLPIAPGAVEVFAIAPNTAYVSAITAAGAGDVYITRGDGL